MHFSTLANTPKPLTTKPLSYGVFGDPAGVLEKLYSGYLLEREHSA
jgi:hypothetical protein